MRESSYNIEDSVLLVDFQDIMTSKEIIVALKRIWLHSQGAAFSWSLTALYINQVGLFFINWVRFLLFLVSLNDFSNNFYFLKFIFTYWTVLSIIGLLEWSGILHKYILSLTNFTHWILILVGAISSIVSAHQMVMAFCIIREKVWFRHLWWVFVILWWYWRKFFVICLFGRWFKSQILINTVLIYYRIWFKCSSASHPQYNDYQGNDNHWGNDNCQNYCSDLIVTLLRSYSLWFNFLFFISIWIVNCNFIHRYNAGSSQRIWCRYLSFYLSQN